MDQFNDQALATLQHWAGQPLFTDRHISDVIREKSIQQRYSRIKKGAGKGQWRSSAVRIKMHLKAEYLYDNGRRPGKATFFRGLANG